MQSTAWFQIAFHECIEAGVPLSSQTIPVRIRGAGQLLVDGAAVPVDGLGRTRVALLPGKHRLELVRAGTGSPLQSVEIQIRGGARWSRP